MSEAEVIDRLRSVRDPELGHDVISLGMIRDIRIQGGVVAFTFELTTHACPLREDFEKAVREAVASVPGVREVKMNVTAQVRSARPFADQPVAPGVKNFVAVASGKGGVGKSTISVNLAAALARHGLKVGILDADVYGPNVPLMMGVNEPPTIRGELIVPPVAHNVKVISIGFFSQEDSPVIWRGPLVAGAVRDFLTRVDWGDLDYLVVDLPPGTGDAPLTLAQLAALSGVLIVTTPQDTAVRVAVKALAMFKRLNAPILGIVENMSHFVCPHCGEKEFIFGQNGLVAEAAKRYAVPLIGQIPLDPQLREYTDRGIPVVVGDPSSSTSNALVQMTRNAAGRISVLAGLKVIK